MFTGIIQKVVTVVDVIRQQGLLRYSLHFDHNSKKKLSTGASVSVDGVCQTVTKIEGSLVWFDAIEETMQRTTLGELHPGDRLNIERAAKVGDEIGGHLVSGHICCRVTLLNIEKNIYTLACPADWMQFVFPKGFVTLNGISLTTGSLNYQQGIFTVHLIPETLERTTMGEKRIGDALNLEVDYLVQSYIMHHKGGHHVAV